MLQAFHSFGSKDAGFDYLGKLQSNNVGPSASTGKLTALVNKGELLVANGDLQMNGADAQQPEREGVLAGRAGRQAQHAGAALLYRLGARRAAKRQRQKLIDFLLSKEAQSSVSAISYGMPVRKDVTPTDDNFRQSQAALKGVDIWAPDWNQVVSSLSADISRWHKVTE